MIDNLKDCIIKIMSSHIQMSIIQYTMYIYLLAFTVNILIRFYSYPIHLRHKWVVTHPR